MEREALSPTGIDCGIAIPHGKSNTVLKTSFAVAILEQPLFISTPKNKESIVAVTACTYGVAHTYLAVEDLKKAAKDNHIDIYIEKQGASGIVDELTHEQINQALGVIIASDVHIRHMERFKNKNILKVKVDEPIKNASQLIYKILN